MTRHSKAIISDRRQRVVLFEVREYKIEVSNRDVGYRFAKEATCCIYCVFKLIVFCIYWNQTKMEK